MSSAAVDNASRPLRSIRSYALRQGKMTDAQRRALEMLWEQYGLSVDENFSGFEKIISHGAPIDLEIGFGRGDSLLELALRHPERQFIGVEVHKPGVGALLLRAHQADVKNLHVYNTDINDVLIRCIPDASLNSIFIFFPDPWHKTRHHKRRLIQPDFVARLASKLKPGGMLHIATDWQDYADHILRVMDQFPSFQNPAGDHLYTARPATRPVTKYEKRGVKLGHEVRDLVFFKST